MRAYRIAWLGICGIVGMAGALAAITWSVATIAFLFGVGAFTGSFVAMVVLTPNDDSPLGRDRWRTVIKSTVLAGAGTVAFGGLGTLVGAAMTPLVLVLTVELAVRRSPLGRLAQRARPSATFRECW